MAIYFLILCFTILFRALFLFFPSPAHHVHTPMRHDMSAPHHHHMPRHSPPSLATTTTSSAPWSRLLALLAPPSSHLKRCQQHAGCHPLATLQVHAALMALTAPHKSSPVSALSFCIQSSYMSLTAASVAEPMGAMAGYREGYKWAKCRCFWWSQQGAALSRPVPLPLTHPSLTTIAVSASSLCMTTSTHTPVTVA